MSASPCATIVGGRARDGAPPCGHRRQDHEEHKDGAFSYQVCRPCRRVGQRWTKQLENRAAGADHWYADGYGGRRTPA